MPRATRPDFGHVADELSKAVINRQYGLVIRYLADNYPERGMLASAAIHIAERLMQYGEANSDYTPVARFMERLEEIE